VIGSTFTTGGTGLWWRMARVAARAGWWRSCAARFRVCLPSWVMAQRRASNGAGSTARHVEQIVHAAEQTAEELRAAAEARANDRIAEAERAAELRVRAADEEAADVRAIAESAAREAQENAAKRAREVIHEARIATREVLRDGETLTGHLRELSDSLRANAERLLIDIRAAHTEMTARLDRVDPDLKPSAGRLDRGAGMAPSSSPEPEVPEFILRRPR